MTSRQPWHQSARQSVLLEYANLRQDCPGGVYVSLKPGNPLVWSGVLFVRKGPYAPAILRFHVRVSPQHPRIPPTVIFTTDVFHPLVTPLTTYTYTTGSHNSDTVSASDDERLPPGSLSLRYGFPHWFDESSRRDAKADHAHQAFSQGVTNQSIPIESSTGQQSTVQMDESSTPSSTPFHANHDKSNSKQETIPSTMLQVLNHVRQCFCEETLLDKVPLEAAGNVGAWKAWRAQRASEGMIVKGKPNGRESPDDREEWNWDGVWQNRVGKGIELSVADSTLYGSGNAEDLPRFLDVDEDLLADVKAAVLGS